MTIYSEGWEGGSDETQVNTTATPFFDSVTVDSTNVFVYDTAKAKEGSFSARYNAGAVGGNCNAVKNLTAPRLRTRVPLSWAGAPNETSEMVSVLNATNDTLAVFYVRAGPTLRIVGATTVTSSVSTPPTDGSWFSVELDVDTASGVAELRIFVTNPDGSTPDETLSTTVPTGTDCGSVIFGNRFGAASTVDQWLDTVTITDAGEDPTPNQPPVIDPQGNVFSHVGDFLDWGGITATDPDGDTLYWSAANLPPGLTIERLSGRITGQVIGREGI